MGAITMLHLVCQWDWGPTLLYLIIVSGFVIVPATVIAWTGLLRARPRSALWVSMCVVLSLIFILWLVAAVAMYRHPPAPPGL